MSPASVVASAAARDRVNLTVARQQLDLMVDYGHLDLHATESGVPPMVYVAPEFLTDHARSQLAS